MAAPLQPQLDIEDLGLVPYADAHAVQVSRVDRVMAAREEPRTQPFAGTLLLVEHPPVVTISNRPTAMDNLLASPELLATHGVSIERTDRGGDITYHGPGQIVVYPILDLNLLNLGLHDYMRLLEQAVIETCATWGIHAEREPKATGVWVPRVRKPAAKIAAMGVRVRRWISMHGLALNVNTNLDHFNLIVPCGLVGREVTSMHRELGEACPNTSDVKAVLIERLRAAINTAHSTAVQARAHASQDT